MRAWRALFFTAMGTIFVAVGGVNFAWAEGDHAQEDALPEVRKFDTDTTGWSEEQLALEEDFRTFLAEAESIEEAFMESTEEKCGSGDAKACWFAGRYALPEKRAPFMERSCQHSAAYCRDAWEYFSEATDKGRPSMVSAISCRR